MIKLPYIKDGKSFAFNLNNFQEEILPHGKNITFTLKEAIHNHFQFTEKKILNDDCYFSQKYDAYILPVYNLDKERNFVIIKNNTVFNPNNFNGYATSALLDHTALITTSVTDIGDQKSWIYISGGDLSFIKQVILYVGVTPSFPESMDGKFLQMVYNAPNNWKIINPTQLEIINPCVEDRTELINIISETHYIEYDHSLFIAINDETFPILQDRCLTLYSAL